MQLDDQAFTVWMERLVEAKREDKTMIPDPTETLDDRIQNSTNVRRDPKQQKKPDLKKYIKPAPELNVEEIQCSFQCMYEDIEEACDLYNLDVEDCRTA